MTQPVNAALARKLAIRPTEPDDTPRPVVRALRLALARAAGEQWNLPLTVIGAKQTTCPQDGLADLIGKDWLLLLFRADNGVMAAVCLNPGAVSAIVQAQAFGEVLPGEPQPRPFTETDAAMVAPLIEDTLARSVDLVALASDQVSLSGFEFASRLPDTRALSLALVEDRYRLFDLTVELGGGARQGQMCFLQPEPALVVETGDAAIQKTGPRLDQAIGVLRAELNSVICRMSLPLTTLSELKVGDVVPLTGARLDRTRLLTIDKSPVAVGRLGQCGGMRAVRLNEQGITPVPADAAALAFLECKPDEKQSIPKDPTAQVDAVEASLPRDTRLLTSADAELNFEDTDQMAAEISQLAGLTGPETDPGHNF